VFRAVSSYCCSMHLGSTRRFTDMRVDEQVRHVWCAAMVCSAVRCMLAMAQPQLLTVGISRTSVQSVIEPVRQHVQ
jgi:hypothetical protein